MLMYASLYRTGLAGERFTVQAQKVDVALSGNFVGSQTQVAEWIAPSAGSFLQFLVLKTISSFYL